MGRRRARPPRTRRSATHGLGKPARGADFTSREEWTFVGSIPALVTEDIFDQVQHKLASNMKQAARNNKSHPYLLRALVSCGACQSACISRTTNGGRSYYACRCLAQPLYSGHDKRCRSRYIPADQLDTIVWHDLVEIISEPEAIVNAFERAHHGQWLPQQLQARREILRKAQAALRQQVERLTEAYLAGIVQLPEYQRRRQELDTRDAGLEQQAKQLSAHVDRQKDISDMAASIEDFCRRIQTGLTNASFAQKRTLVELLVDRVLVINDQVEIRYLVPTHARAETTRFCHLRKDYFEYVVEIAHRTTTTASTELSGPLQFRDDLPIGRIAVHVDHPRPGMAWRPQCFLEETFGRSRIALGREEKNRSWRRWNPPLGINRSTCQSPERTFRPRATSGLSFAVPAGSACSVPVRSSEPSARS